MKEAWAYIKNYSWIILIGVVGILVILGTMGGSKEFIIDLLRKQKQQFKKELDVIESAKKEQEEIVKKNEERYADAVKEIEKKFHIKEAELKASEKKAIKKLVKDFEASPANVAKEIAEKRGWEYIS